MIEREVLVDSIRTDHRQRELGDIESLAKSMADIGLIFPVVLGRDEQLLWGLRRLTAAKFLAWPTIDAVVVEDLLPALELLKVENNDTTERRPMTPSEMVQLGLALEWLDEPARSKRRARSIRTGRWGGEDSAIGIRLREVLAPALGCSTATYARAKHMIITAETHPDPAVRAVAVQQIEIMDRTGNVSAAHERVRALTRPREWTSATGFVSPLVGATAQRKAFDAALASLKGTTDGLARIVTVDSSITPDEVAQWVDDLVIQRRIIERTINRLRQHATKGQST